MRQAATNREVISKALAQRCAIGSEEHSRPNVMPQLPRELADMAPAWLPRSVPELLQAVPVLRDWRDKNTPCSWLYFVRARAQAAVKIGISEDLQRRLDTLQNGNAYPLELIGVVRLPRRSVRSAETLLHLLLEPVRLNGEWFHDGVEVAAVVALLQRGRYMQDSQEVGQ